MAKLGIKSDNFFSFVGIYFAFLLFFHLLSF